MKFIALDIETANADLASICSIGVAHFENGIMIDSWYSLVDPDDYFDAMNVSIHGITEDMILGQPTFDQIAPILMKRLEGSVVATHTHFDRVAIQRAAANSETALPNCIWLDTACVARRAWPTCAHKGYGLRDVCREIGYTFNHHHALEDAKACGKILIEAMRISDLDLTGWLARIQQPIDPTRSSVGAAVRRSGDPDGPLFGESVVFTGALSVNRADAADLAAGAGCRVESGVTKKTTLLVVGDMDVTRLAGHNKSGKHRKAEDLIAKGQALRILRESDFLQMIAE